MATTEPTLIARLKQGDRQAFDVVYAGWRARIFSFLVRQLGDRAAAEDALQETFLRLAAHRTRLRDDTDIGAWLFTVARHLAVSYGRGRSVTRWALGVLRQTADSRRASAAREELAPDASITRLENALAALPPPYREVLLLVAAEGLEPAQAAAVIGIRPDALRKRLSRARAMLSQELADEPVAPVVILHHGARR